MSRADVSEMIRWRDFVQADAPMVVSTWINGYRTHGVAAHVRADEYHRGQRRVIELLLDVSRVVVAADPEDDDVIYGWACGDRSALHWAYVKPDLRCHGIGHELVARLGLAGQVLHVTHWTPEVRTLAPTVVYDPYLLFREGGPCAP